MMRPRRRRPSPRAASAWLIVVGGLGLYGFVVLVLVRAGAWPGPLVPWWVTQAGPPVVYGAIVRLCVRRVSVSRWIVATFCLWAVHVLLALLTGNLVARFGASPIETALTGALVPLLPIFWVPLLLLPLRDLLSGDPPPPSRLEARDPERSVPLERRAPAPAPVPAAAPGTSEQAATWVPAGRPSSPRVTLDAETRPQEPRETGWPSSRVDHVGPASERLAPETARAGVRAIGDPLLPGNVLGHETSAEVVRVSFDRVASQLPTGVFHLPLERMAASLLEPGYLLIPQALVVDQLAEGLVRAEWDVVGEQFPRHLLAMTDEEIRRQLPDGQLVLPLDELVPQLPPDLFVPIAPPAEIEGIESVPEPFRPAIPEADVEEPPLALALDVPSAEQAATVNEPPSSEIEWTLAGEETELERHDLLELEDIDLGPVLTGGAEVEPGPESLDAAPADAPPSWLVSSVEHSIDEHAEMECTASERPAMRDLEPAPVLPEPAESGLGPALESEPVFGGGEWREDSRKDLSRGWEVVAAASSLEAPPQSAEDKGDQGTTLHDVAAVFAPFTVLEVGVDPVDGVRLFTVSSPGLCTKGAVAAAKLLVPLLGAGRAPWRVSQMTLRSPDIALILTPLGQGGSVLVSAAAPGGPLALLEILSLRAAANRASAAEPSPRSYSDPGEERRELDLLATEPPAHVRQIAADLGAVGPVKVGALRDPAAERDFYLFLPSGSDVRAMGSFACELDRAMREAGGSGYAFHTAVLRCGDRRLVMRLGHAAAGASTLVIAGGETKRPGLAFRQVESAALALGTE